MAIDTDMEVVKYGEHTINLVEVPKGNIHALIRRGLAHYLGNEQASKVTSHFGDEEVTDEAKNAFKAECVTKAIEVLLNGVMGAGRMGVPRGTAIETVVRQMATKEVVANLKHNKLAMPKKAEDTITINAGQANERKLTRNDLIAAWVKKHGERLTKAAEAEMKRQAKLAEAAGNLDEAFTE